MTDRDDLRELIRDVLAEQARQHSYAKRDPLVRFSDPEGKNYWSATVSRMQALSLLLTLLGMIGGVVWSAMSARDQLVVLPRVRAMVELHDAMPTAHAAIMRAADEEIDEVRSTAAAVTRGRDEQISALKESITELRKQNERIDAKIDRLLARR